MVKQSKTKPVFSPLSKGDEKLLTKARHLRERICDYYTDLKPRDIGPAELDRVYELWMGDQQSQKPRDDEVVNGLGALIGFLMLERHGFKWMKTRDVWGEGLTAIHPKTHWQIYPINFVWKRVKETEPKGGFFKALHDHIAKEIKKKKTHNNRLHRIADKPGSR
jgi:Domain of unknown function (DUF3806)